MLEGPEQELAKSLISVLLSPKYKDRNYLFREPFDLAQVPGYMDVVQKPLDLQTVSNNLENDAYDTMDAFMVDLNLIFQNAIAYHGNRETKWIAKLAKDMLKVVQKEKARLENPSKKNTIKLKLGKQLPKAPTAPHNNNNLPSPQPVHSSADTAALSPDALVPSTNALASSSTAAATAKKTKIKLKLGVAKSTSAAPPKAVKAKPTQPKLKLKLTLKSKGTAVSDNNSVQSSAGLSSSPALAPPPTPPVSAAAVTGVSSSALNSAAESAVSALTDSDSKKKTKPKKAASKAQSAKDKKKDASSTKATSKASAATAAGRGKELPKGVAAPPPASAGPPTKTTSTATSTSTTTSSTTTATPIGNATATTITVKSSKSTKTSIAKAAAAAGLTAGETAKQRKTKQKKTPMSQDLHRQCTKVILGLKRRQPKDISWFLQPVTDKNIVQDYRAKIRFPMDVQRITTKLENKHYTNLPDFCLDVRRICANCLRYNTSMKDSIRHSAVQVLETAEQLMAVFLTQPDYPPYPRLLYCWKLCLNVLDTLCNIVNPGDNQQTIFFFLHPVSAYCGGQFPPDYMEKITKPMDFGTVVSNLVEGRYQSVSEFSDDCHLIIQNTKTYYGDRQEGEVFVNQANHLDRVLSSQLDQLARYDKSKSQADKQRATFPQIPIIKPPVPLLLSVLEELRAVNYTDNATKITEACTGPFEKPVSLAAFPDYLQHVSEPMDLSTVEKRIKSGSYETPEDFEYDMTLTFRNCEIYNAKRNGDHFVKMAKFATKHFRRIFQAKMRFLEDPLLQVESGEVSEPPLKKVKMESSAPVSGTSKGKTTPRITLSSAAVNAAARASSKSPRPPSVTSQKKPGKPPASNQPLPLHIAISRVKEAFPLRRAVKNLQAMEADLAKYLKDLMRHPWLSAARPKFIFHVPVTMLFPDLKEAYAAKIRKPMDLTTVECTLLAGNRYTSPEDFLQDIALTFSNAIKFNKDGRDIGDPASCAYYDASVHLLRYARWLSLEQLSSYVEDSDHVDEYGPDGLPPLQWKLTTRNLAKAREEQKIIVLDEPIERSLEGDRWTWHEAECEKLLKALRHQSDNKHMKFFVHSEYPPNYSAYIANPMDWDKVQRKLRKREYERFGQIIADLRLIFENAKKYNGRFTDLTSQAAYAAAQHMAGKLDSAIRRLMLSVSDRIERERIDHANAEREEEALERAEDARIRDQWKKDHAGDESAPPPPSRIEGQRMRLRKTVASREDADFEIPYFDEENEGQHERSYNEVIKFQKSMFEKQRQDLTQLRRTTSASTFSLRARMLRQAAAQEWAKQEREKGGVEVSVANASLMDASKEGCMEKANGAQPSAVLKILEQGERQHVRLAIVSKKKQGRYTRRSQFSFD